MLKGLLYKIHQRLFVNYLVENRRETLWHISRLITISNQHQKTFAGFKGCNTGKDVVMIGAGPSVNKFKLIPNCIYVGLNSACKLKQVKFDYLFTIDRLGIDKIYPEFASVDCVKFVGDQNLGSKFQIPESEMFKMGDVRRYMTDAGLWIYPKGEFALNIESQPLANYNTVSLQAMQFILYTNPRKIYIVGIDCSTSGHFSKSQGTADELRQEVSKRNENLDVWANTGIQAWHEMKEFASVHYPDTEIVSVNPVGLKGLFTDLIQTEE